MDEDSKTNPLEVKTVGHRLQLVTGAYTANQTSYYTHKYTTTATMASYSR